MPIFFRLLGLFRPCGFGLFLGLLLAVITQLANIALMATSGWFIAAMSLAGITGIAINYYLPAVMIRAFAILRTVGRYTERLVGHDSTLRGISLLRVWLFSRLESLSPEDLQHLHSGDIEGGLREDLDRLETVYLRQFLPVCVAVLIGAAVSFWLFLHAFSLGFAFLVCFLAAGFLVPWVMFRRSHHLGKAGARLSRHLSKSAIDATQGMGELLVFGAASGHFRRFQRISDRLIRLQLKQNVFSSFSAAFSQFAAQMALWCVVVLAIPLVASGVIEPPDLMMLALAALAAFEASTPLPAVFLEAGWVAQSARHVFALADAGEERRLGQNSAHNIARSFPENPHFSVENIRFHYRGASRPVFENLSFTLEPGKKLGLVGRAGSGKTTLTLLLSGLLEPTAGRICINGEVLSSFAPENIRGCFAVAPQKPSLLSGTIRDSLRLGAPDASDAQIWQALEIVRLDGFVRALPGQLDAWIGEAGYNISGGQARRLSIARALLHPAPFLVLDEPAENLDTITEQEMIENILASLEKRGVILITHRALGLCNMDQIIRLEG